MLIQILLAAMVTLSSFPMMLCSNMGIHGGTGGCDCPSRHPQQKFCDESLVVKGTITRIGNAEVTGHHVNDGGMNMDMVIGVTVNEVFKGNETMLLEDTIFLHTYGMCRFEMMLHVGEVYLLSANDIYQPGYFMILRGCSWAQSWEAVTREQLNGLRRDYHDCHLCEVSNTLNTHNVFDDYSFLEEQSAADQPIGSCFHDRQMGMIMRQYQDCETLYSACVVRNDQCEWLENREYRKCMKKRKKGQKGRKGKGGRPWRHHKPKHGNHHGRVRGETTG